MSQFKKALSAMGVCAALVASAQANAATTATLNVTGSIIPAACSVALSNNGEVAFGTIAAASIRTAPANNSLVQLGAKDINLTISCEANAAIGFKMLDNRASSAVALSSTAFLEPTVAGDTAINQSYFGFGLGLASNNAKIGTYSVTVDGNNITADGAEAGIIYTDDTSGGTWRKSASGTIHQENNNLRTITISSKGGAEPKMFTEATLPLSISAGVQTSAVLGSDEITLDGNATVSLVYL